MSLSKIRIALVVRPAAGGIRRHIATLLSSLDRDRYRFTLFAPADFADFALEFAIPHVPLDIAPRTAFLRDSGAIRNLSQHLGEDFDLVHAHGVRGAWIGALSAAHEDLPCLFTAHNLVPRLGLLSRFGLNQAARRCGRIIAVSQAVAGSLRQNGVDAEKIVVIPNGVAVAPFDAPFDAALFRNRLNVPLDAPLIVAVGRLSREKGFDVLLRALPQVQAEIPSARLILVGDGPEANRLKSLTKGNPSVLFAGHTAEAAPFLRMGDVAAIPSRQEGQGIVALEAMAARRPVVASRVGGLVETVIANETGRFVPPDDPPALAAALVFLLRDNALRERFGAAGRLRVEENYTTQNMARQVAACYDSLRP